MRGQIAFMVIIGVLVILAMVGALVIFSYDPPTRPPATSERFELESCATYVLDESVSLVSLYGGYYDASEQDLLDMNGRDFAVWSNAGAIPSDTRLEEEIERALVARMDRCTSELGSPNIDADVTLASSEAQATISIDGALNGDGSAEMIAPFTVRTRTPMLEVHSIARDVAQELWDESVLTDLNLNVLALDPDVPLEGFDISCQPTKWSFEEVRESFFASLEDTVAYVSYDGQPRVSSPKVRQKFTFDLDSVTDDVDVASYYFTDYGGSFEVEERAGNLMTSYVTRSPDGGFCQNSYRFWYSVDYPIVFTVAVPHMNDRFYYRFAVPVSVSRNVVEEPVIEDTSFCSDVTPREFTLDIISEGSPLSDVDATITCGSERCPLTSTLTGIEDHLPARCLSGTLTIAKEGYDTVELDYRYDERIDSPVELDPLTRISYSVEGDAPFEARLIATGDGVSIPIASETFIPADMTRILVIESRPTGPIVTYELEVAGDTHITIDSDSYTDPEGLGITQIFEGVTGGERV